MRPRTRTILLVLSYAVAILGGAVLGAWFSFNTVKASRTLTGEVVIAELWGARAFADRLMGDPVAYRTTLLGYLAALSAQRGGAHVILTDHSLAVDIVLTETRLALLAESQADAGETRKYFQQAVADCGHAWKKGECTEQHLRDIVLRLDRSPAQTPSGQP